MSDRISTEALHDLAGRHVFFDRLKEPDAHKLTAIDRDALLALVGAVEVAWDRSDALSQCALCGAVTLHRKSRSGLALNHHPGCLLDRFDFGGSA